MSKDKSVTRLSMVDGKPVGRRYAKIGDAADYLSVNPLTIRNLINSGRIHGYRSSARLHPGRPQRDRRPHGRRKLRWRGMTTLYRAYDAADRLLYVGIADKLVTERLLQHSSPGSFIGHWILNGDSLIGARWGGGWTDDMTTVRVKHYDDRKAAMAAESAAIRDEHPLFNRSGQRRSNAPG